MSMREITKDEADRLRKDTANYGFWAIWLRLVDVHPKGRYVINVDNRWFVVEPHEFKLVPQGVVKMPVPKHLQWMADLGLVKPKLKEVHTVHMSEEINALVKRDAARAGKIDICGVEAANGNTVKPKDEP
jgi:hypothetical protein